MILKSRLWLMIFILISGILFLFPLITFAQTPIQCGQTISGSISTVGEKDDYTFTASPNDKVTIRLVVTARNSGNRDGNRDSAYLREKR